LRLAQVVRRECTRTLLDQHRVRRAPLEDMEAQRDSQRTCAVDYAQLAITVLLAALLQLLVPQELMGHQQD